MKIEPCRNTRLGNESRLDFPYEKKVQSQNIYEHSFKSIIFKSNTTFESQLDGDPIIIYSEKDIIINSGVTLTTSNRCKGIFLIAKNNLIINGSIIMTARGTYTPIPNHLYIDFLKLIIGYNGIIITDEFIPNFSTYEHIDKDFSCASGGRGNSVKIAAVAGGTGSIFSGGSGSGGEGGLPGNYGGPGGTGQLSTSYKTASGGGGAGNPGGKTLGGCGSSANGSSGTGGLIFLIAFNDLILSSTARLESKGSPGGKGASNIANVCEGRGSGGGSGGGFINLYHGNKYENTGAIDTTGGPGGPHTVSGTSYGGYAGDTGKIRIINF